MMSSLKGGILPLAAFAALVLLAACGSRQSALQTIDGGFGDAVQASPILSTADGQVTSPPASIAWGERHCDSCTMSIDAPGFAVQVTTVDGRLLAFDDPGCLVIEIEMERLTPVAMWFHHADENRWLNGWNAGFVRRDNSPMAFGYAAVGSRSADLSFEQVRAEMRERFQLKP